MPILAGQLPSLHNWKMLTEGKDNHQDHVFCKANAHICTPKSKLNSCRIYLHVRFDMRK